MTNIFNYKFSDLPATIPVFPLTGVLLLPRVPLPLNIFEARYLQMVNDALRGDRLIGMIQPKHDNQLYDIGCAGRITSYQETDDGRMLITLTGVCRFKIINEIQNDKLYRTMNVNWDEFKDDMNAPDQFNIDRKHLCGILKLYFEQHDMSMDWSSIDIVGCEKLMNMLSIICPLEPNEKQALLETKCEHKRADLLIKLLRMHIHCYAENDNEIKIH
jgi:Lon protease-like protein